METSLFYRIRLGPTYCYLLKCEECYLLIDTSYSKYFKQFQKSIASFGISIHDIKYLLLSHHHDDHVGFAADLIKNTGCRLIIHQNAIKPLKNGKPEIGNTQPANRRARIAIWFVKWFHRQAYFPSVNIGDQDLILKDDNFELLKSIGINGIIIYTPGHTQDSISIILSDGSAFVGDAAMNLPRLTGLRHIPILIADKNAVYSSWRRLKEYGAKVIYPSHGSPFSVQELNPLN